MARILDQKASDGIKRRKLKSILKVTLFLTKMSAFIRSTFCFRDVQRNRDFWEVRAKQLVAEMEKRHD